MNTQFKNKARDYILSLMSDKDGYIFTNYESYVYVGPEQVAVFCKMPTTRPICLPFRYKGYPIRIKHP